jgi:hypothetical protein
MVFPLLGGPTTAMQGARPDDMTISCAPARAGGAAKARPAGFGARALTRHTRRDA